MAVNMDGTNQIFLSLFTPFDKSRGFSIEFQCLPVYKSKIKIEIERNVNSGNIVRRMGLYPFRMNGVYHEGRPPDLQQSNQLLTAPSPCQQTDRKQSFDVIAPPLSVSLPYTPSFPIGDQIPHTNQLSFRRD